MQNALFRRVFGPDDRAANAPRASFAPRHDPDDCRSDPDSAGLCRSATEVGLGGSGRPSVGPSTARTSGNSTTWLRLVLLDDMLLDDTVRNQVAFLSPDAPLLASIPHTARSGDHSVTFLLTVLLDDTVRNQVAFLSPDMSPSGGHDRANGGAGHPGRRGWYSVHPT